jgi:lipid II:glycine glycyltransferase (peptidoglycan interpeptide bridge formation enzyme)
MQILHLRHKEIDKKKWDETVARGCNLPYMLSWWLDTVCPNWEALIAGDYELIFPLTVRRIGPLKMIEHPVLTQQLGLIAADGHTPTTEEVDTFIKNMPYWSYMLCLNERNRTTHADQVRLNLKLPLNHSYEEISSRFCSNTKRNIKKAETCGLNVTEASADEFLNFYITHNLHNNAKRETLEELLAAAQSNNACEIISAKKNGETVAAVMFLKFKNRLVYLLPASSKDGKDSRAMFLIINNIIKTRCNSDMELDFEGSMAESVARFYKGFGATEHHYCRIRRMTLLHHIRKILCRIRGRK